MPVVTTLTEAILGTQTRKAVRKVTPALRNNGIENRERCCRDGEDDVDSCPVNKIKAPCSHAHVSIQSTKQDVVNDTLYL